MIWLTWRQLRKQVLYTAIALAGLAAVMVPTGLAMRRNFTGSGLADCVARLGTAQLVSGDDCNVLREQFFLQYRVTQLVEVLFIVLPVFVGLFFGAPLVAREVEHGTHRLVWTQGTTRRRWALVKFGVVGAVTLVLAVAYAIGVSWWFAPFAAAGSGRLGPIGFDEQGIAPIGYTLFAVALGVFAGAVSRRLLAAMAITLCGFTVVRVVVEAVARPRYMAPETLSVPVNSVDQFNPVAGDWIFSQGVINAAGTLVLPNSRYTCDIAPESAITPSPPPVCGEKLIQRGLGPAPFSNWMQYHPGNRFWTFQFIETGIFLVLAALLLYLAIRVIRRIA